MFEIGFWELALIGVVALIVVGPERLPGLARTAGLWLGKARRMVAEVKAEVDRELHLEEIKQSLRQQADLNELHDLAGQVKSLRREVEEEFDDPGPPPGWRPGMPTGAPPPPYSAPSAPAVPAIPVSAPVRLEKTGSPPADPSVAAPTPPPQPSSPPPSNPPS